MARSLTSGMSAAITAEALSPIVLVTLEFDSGDLRLWNGIGDITYDSNTYTGAGVLLSVSEMAETLDLEANGLTLSLSGVDSDILSYALSEDYQGRAVTVLFASLNTSFAVISDPIDYFYGYMDVMSIEEDGNTASIVLTVESELLNQRSPRIRNWTTEDQAVDYSGDTGFSLAAGLKNKEFVWGYSES